MTLHAKEHVPHTMKEVLQEPERCDLEPVLTSLRWSNTYAEEIQADMPMETQRGRFNVPFKKKKA